MSDQPSTSPVTEAAEAPQPSPAPTPTPVRKPGDQSFIWGTGRRKTAVARVRIRHGNGRFEVNKRPLDEFFCIDRDRAMVRQPLTVTDSAKNYDVFVNVCGGGITGQAGAVILGLARALNKDNPDFGPKLREAGLLTRDAREVERKKYGRAGARKRFQFSKR